MNELEKYRQQTQQEIVQFEGPMDEENISIKSLVLPVFRRWYVFAVTFILACAIGVPAIWFLTKPMYDTEGAILISQIVNPILFDTKEKMGNYENFLNTQAKLIAGNNVLNRVADDLADRKLYLFEKENNPVTALKKAASDGSISIKPVRNTELIQLTMTTGHPRHAEQIIDSFIRAYMAVIVSEEITGGDTKLAILEDKRRTLSDKIDRQREAIRQLVDEYGTGELTGRQEMMLQTVARLQEDLISITIRRISLEAQVHMHESGLGTSIPPEDMLERRRAFVNSDPLIQALTKDVTRYEELVIIAKQTLAPNNPEIKRRIDTLEILKDRLVSRRQEVTEEFQTAFDEELEKTSKYRLAQINAELEQTIDHEKRIREKLEKYDTDTIGMGRKQFAIDDQKEQLGRTKEMYEIVADRIDEIQMERKRPARISVAYNASSVPSKSKKSKLMLASIFGAMGLGALLAFLIDKADKAVREPRDVAKRIGVRIIGTTTSPKDLDRPLLAQQLTNDYQTIRANLGLFEDSFKSRVIAVTSPGSGDGKTTFAVNLASSFAQSGEKVLLVDGDFRKPDIARILGISKRNDNLQDWLFGEDFDKALYSVASSNLKVLSMDGQDATEVINLLGKPRTRENIRKISVDYDHVIIDTPPVLAFSDALLWAKMSDAVILTSLANRTSSPDLKDAIDRLNQIGVNILGTVLQNVKASSSYHRYSYGYGEETSSNGKKRSKDSDNINLLFPTEQLDDKNEEQTEA